MQLKIVQHWNRVNSIILSDTVTSLLVSFPPFQYNNNPCYPYKIWAGSNSGVSILNLNGTFTTLDTSNSLLPSNHINKITVQDFDSLAFICTDSGFATISTVSNKLLHVYTKKNSPLNNSNVTSGISYLRTAKKNGMSITTMGGGINVVDTNGVWTVYSKATGNNFSDSISFTSVSDIGIGVSYSDLRLPITGTKDIGFLGFNEKYSFGVLSIFKGDTIKAINDYDLISESGPEAGYETFVCTTTDGFIYYGTDWSGGINELNNPDFFNTYFNSNTLHIDWNKLQQGNVTIQLYDVLGRKVFENVVATNDKQCETTVHDLVPALYIVSIQQKENKQTGKVVWMK